MNACACLSPDPGVDEVLACAHLARSAEVETLSVYFPSEVPPHFLSVLKRLGVEDKIAEVSELTLSETLRLRAVDFDLVLLLRPTSPWCDASCGRSVKLFLVLLNPAWTVEDLATLQMKSERLCLWTFVPVDSKAIHPKDREWVFLQNETELDLLVRECIKEDPTLAPKLCSAIADRDFVRCLQLRPRSKTHLHVDVARVLKRGVWGGFSSWTKAAVEALASPETNWIKVQIQELAEGRALFGATGGLEAHVAAP